MTLIDYQDKHVIVTGCSSGIGQAAAKALTELGADVHGLDIKTPATATGLGSFDTLDLADSGSIAAAAASIAGPVHALFNCAGAPPTFPSADILKVNFLGTRLLTELLIPLMPSGAAIANTSSDGGFSWRKQLPLLNDFLAVGSFHDGAQWYARHEQEAGHAYAFSKKALNLWTMQQSALLITRGIRINTCSPGAVQTPMLETIEANFPAEMIAATTYPIGRRSTPQEQVGPLLFLNSDSASYVNGADLAVDGGHWASLSAAGELWD